MATASGDWLRAVEAYLEELADARAVEVPRSRGGEAILWVELKRRHWHGLPACGSAGG